METHSKIEGNKVKVFTFTIFFGWGFSITSFTISTFGGGIIVSRNGTIGEETFISIFANLIKYFKIISWSF